MCESVGPGAVSFLPIGLRHQFHPIAGANGAWGVSLRRPITGRARAGDNGTECSPRNGTEGIAGHVKPRHLCSGSPKQMPRAKQLWPPYNAGRCTGNSTKKGTEHDEGVRTGSVSATGAKAATAPYLHEPESRTLLLSQRASPIQGTLDGLRQRLHVRLRTSTGLRRTSQERSQGPDTWWHPGVDVTIVYELRDGRPVRDCDPPQIQSPSHALLHPTRSPSSLQGINPGTPARKALHIMRKPPRLPCAASKPHGNYLGNPLCLNAGTHETDRKSTGVGISIFVSEAVPIAAQFGPGLDILAIIFPIASATSTIFQRILLCSRVWRGTKGDEAPLSQIRL